MPPSQNTPRGALFFPTPMPLYHLAALQLGSASKHLQAALYLGSAAAANAVSAIIEAAPAVPDSVRTFTAVLHERIGLTDAELLAAAAAVLTGGILLATRRRSGNVGDAVAQDGPDAQAALNLTPLPSPLPSACV